MLCDDDDGYICCGAWDGSGFLGGRTGRSLHALGNGELAWARNECGVETGRYMLRWEASMMATSLDNFFAYHYYIVKSYNI